MPLTAVAPDSGPIDGYDIDVQVGFLLRRAHQRHTALFQERMAPLDLTPTQFNALIRVVELGSVTQNQLGRLSAMDPATIQGVVRRLEDRGLVQRRPDPGDRRATLLTATAAGTGVAAEAVRYGHDITAATLAPLTPIERVRMLEMLRKLG